MPARRRAITQFFFDNEVYFRYLDRVRDRGITIPIVPGIIPIHNFKQVSGFAAKSGASVPEWLGHRFEGLDDDQETRHLVAAAVAAEQVHGPRRPGHHRVSLLHAEPRRPRLRHLPSPGLAPGSDGRVQGEGRVNDPRTTHRRAEAGREGAHPDPRWRHGHHDPALQARRGRLSRRRASRTQRTISRATTICSC